MVKNIHVMMNNDKMEHAEPGIQILNSSFRNNNNA